jgi:long-chain acyl-CoA synthetase
LTDTDIPDAPRTIAELPFFAGGRFPKPDLLGRCDPTGVSHVSGRDLVDRVRDLSLGLSVLGMRRGDRVAILSESRPEWLLADLAILAAGGVTTPLYPTLSVEQIGPILQDSEPVIVVVSDTRQLAKAFAASRDAPSVRTIVVIDPPPERSAADRVEVIDLAEVAARGHRQILDGWGVGRAFHDEAKKVRPEDPATLIYTSGTTAAPKGVLLTHGNLTANLIGIRQVLRLDERDTALSFLPLCHAFERMVAYVYMASGVSMIFAESIDTVARDLLRVRPTIMTGVPRVFEKLRDKVNTTGRARPGLRRAVFDWSVSVAERRGADLSSEREPSWWLRLEARLADALVFEKVRDGLGGRLRFAVSGGAPLRPEIGRFFYGAGLPLLEGYGLTETSPVVCVMPLERIRFGTVGPPLPNVEVRIAEDGEILVRGPSVMRGYYRRDADTAAVLRDGWFYTGDIGALDAAGYLRITDRKKELLVTSGGKKIAPQAIESALKAHPVIEEAVVIAEQRRFASALVVPNLAYLTRELGAPTLGDPAARAAFAEHDGVRARVQAAVDAVNAHLAQFEQIKKFAVLPRPFTQEAGELTPTLKVKRRVVEEKYRDVIERMYAEGVPRV